jgi:environmental stress-induced protein Ves
VNAERIALDELVARPWKNGAGLTREVAVAPRDATLERFDWRISVARIDRDAPFSAFPGVDRCIALLRGDGMRLRSDDGAVDARLVTVGEPFGFAGEAALAATVVDGPCDDFNVMVRRGHWQAEVTCIDSEQRLPSSDAALLLALDGAWRCDTADGLLLPRHAWLWRMKLPPARVVPATPDSRALLVRLSCHDRAMSHRSASKANSGERSTEHGP